MPKTSKMNPKLRKLLKDIVKTSKKDNDYGIGEWERLIWWWAKDAQELLDEEKMANEDSRIPGRVFPSGGPDGQGGAMPLLSGSASLQGVVVERECVFQCPDCGAMLQIKVPKGIFDTPVVTHLKHAE